MYPAVLLAIAVPCATLSAQSSHGADLSIGVRAGTLGIGGEINKLITSHLGIRGSVNYFKASTTQTQSDISFDAHLKLQAITGLIDLYPSHRGSFHLTGGIISNPITIDATGVPNDGSTYTINGHDYSAAQVGTLTGSAKYPKTSGYAGLGWGTPAARHAGLKLVFDIGAAIGKPTILLSATNQDPTLQSDLAAQQVKTQTDVNKYAKVYPVISFGLVARF
jgi:hypothetical protein